MQRRISSIRKRILSAVIGCAMLLTAVPVSAANVEETPDYQLQTILIDNNGKDWTTTTWGGQNLTPNTNWTTLTLEDYYENGIISFDVMNNGSGTVKFNFGLASYEHGTESRLRLSELEEYNGYFTASPEWKTYTLSIKEIVDKFPDSDFTLRNFRFLFVNGVPSDTTLSLRNVKISSSDDERQYPFWKVNQVGYFCDAVKTAKISCFAKFGSLDGKTWELINADTGKTVLTGTLGNAVPEEEFSGEMVHTIRFDEVTETGTYYFQIKDAGLDDAARSPYDIANALELDTLTSVKFRIADDVYDALMDDLTKYYYYQRQGITIEQEYAGDFARENLHPDDVAVRRWSDRDDPDAQSFDVSGGYGGDACPCVHCL